MQSVASQLQQVQEEEEQTEQFGRDAEDMLEEKRRAMCQFVNESVDLMKSQINKRKMEKLSLLGKQREKLEQQMESLRQGKSTMQTALQDLEAISFIQGSKDLLKRLEAMSDLKTTPLTVLDFSKEKNNLDMLIKLNKNFLEKILRPVQHVVMVELDRNNLRSLYGQTPRLDPNSAHPLMMISQDLRVATLTKTQHPYPEHPDRFDICPQVVSSESFSSGRHYWEVDGVLAAKYPHVSESIQSVASQLQQVQEKEEQTEQSGRDAEDMLEEKRRSLCQFVNDSVDLMKSEINKRKMEKLSLLGKQREKLQQQMESLRQGKSTMDLALQELDTISFLQGTRDLLKRLETMSEFNSMKMTPITVLDFSKEEKNLDALIKLNKDFLEKMQSECHKLDIL
uniref:B30.2/SPRY domain-containing protein n=1 Tax=Eptatretus burgeri TaxID=7764 RepID=A0A8C4N0E6_EPTBU